MRIVSLLPSATEIICALGLDDQLVGVTHECDDPAFVRDLPKVTKTLIPRNASSAEIDALVREQLKTTSRSDSRKALYSLDLPTLERLRPDLLVTQALCDVCAVAEDEVNAAACSLPGNPRVINLEPMRLADVMETIRVVGAAAGVAEKAEQVVASLNSRVARVTQITQNLSHRPRVMLLEWIDPPFGAGHWSPELVRIAGGIEGIGREGEKSRTVAWDEVVQWDPEVLVIACCGFDVERTMRDIPILTGYAGFNDLSCVRTGNVFVMDGNAYFSRPGPRLVDGLEILANALHGELFAIPEGLLPARRVAGEDET